MAGLQARFLAMLQEQEDHQGATKVTQKRKRSDNDSGEDNLDSDDNGKPRGTDDDGDEEVAQKYAWIGVEIPKPSSRNGASDRSGFNKKNVCIAMGIDEEKFHFIQVSDFLRADCIP